MLHLIFQPVNQFFNLSGTINFFSKSSVYCHSEIWLCLFRESCHIYLLGKKQKRQKGPIKYQGEFQISILTEENIGLKRLKGKCLPTAIKTKHFVRYFIAAGGSELRQKVRLGRLGMIN